MCDFSLDFVASRPAIVGDKLVSARFDNSFTRGFAAVGEPGVAVCLLPGTELAFEKAVECMRGFGFVPNLLIDETVARFRQVNMDKPNLHHDALQFPSERLVLLHNLSEGQRATVLQLPAIAHGASTASAVRVRKAGTGLLERQQKCHGDDHGSSKTGGRTSMEMRHDQQKAPDGSAEQRISNELVKLIRKLRWMGLEKEAEKVQSQLTLRDVVATDSVVAVSRETD
jgi:hypothetical protein